MKKKELIIGGLLGFILLTFSIITAIHNREDGNLHVIFCNVGQGDAILIRTPSGQDILFDGGPDDSVLNCLAQNLPFWDRTIEMIIVSHPQSDHISGILSVLPRYRVEKIVMGIERTEMAEYQKLQSLIAEKRISVHNPYRGELIDFGDGSGAKILWPEKTWLLSRLQTKNPVLGISTVINKEEPPDLIFDGDLNQTSTVALLYYGNFTALLTGDADSPVQPKMLTDTDFPEAEVLKVPHHGSKSALTNEFLAKVKPSLAIISVGKNNRFGHPAGSLLKELSNFKIPVKRTDRDGTVKIVSDGKTWRME